MLISVLPKSGEFRSYTSFLNLSHLIILVWNDRIPLGYIFLENFKNHLIITTSRRSRIAPKKPRMVIIVSVFISGLCTGHALS